MEIIVLILFVLILGALINTLFKGNQMMRSMCLITTVHLSKFWNGYACSYSICGSSHSRMLNQPYSRNHKDKYNISFYCGHYVSGKWREI